MGEPERHGRLLPGWQQQGLSLPIPMRKLLAAEAKSKGQGGIKLIGTAAIGALLGMPKEARSRFLLAVTEMSWKRDLVDVAPEEFFDLMLSAIQDLSETEELRWEVTRILDPELTPRPGEKQSDREASEKRRKSG